MAIRVSINHADRLPVSDELIERAVEAVMHAEDRTECDLAVVFLGDSAIRELNREFLEHDWPTDVLSFPLDPDPGGSTHAVSGEIYIGAERARVQAAENQVSPLEEAVRLAVHGTLHLVGHDHPAEEREGSAFFVRQEELVQRVLSEWNR